MCRRPLHALYFLKVYELGRGPLGGSPRATAPYLGAAPGYDRQADIRDAKGGYDRLCGPRRSA